MILNVTFSLCFQNLIHSYMYARDQPILLLFSPIFLSGNSFFLPIMLKILLEASILCVKLSYIP